MDQNRAGELRRRQQVYSEALAGLGRLEPAIRSYRAEVLQKELLTEEQMRRFCRSHVLANFSLERLRDEGVPLVGHQESRIVETCEKETSADGNVVGFRERIEMYVEPPGVVLRADFAETQKTFARDGVPVTGSIEALWCEFPGQRGVDRREVKPDSVLGRLASLSFWLAGNPRRPEIVKRYPWRPWQVVDFILTDRVPIATALRSDEVSLEAAGLEHRQLTLTVAPWVSPDDVREWYQQHLRQVVRGRQRDREMGERSAEVFAFVVREAPQMLLPSGARTELRENSPDVPECATWGALLARWNREAPPEWRYEGKNALQGGFWRAFTRWRDLLFPPISGVTADEESSQ